MLNKKNLRMLFAIFLFFSSFCFAQTNDTRESIREFDASIIVNRDASIDVIEKITVYADQDRIRHGLMRWLPIHYMDSYGITHHTHYQLRSILVNNNKSDYHTEQSNQDLKIYIGNRKIILEPGIYTYILQYHVNDAVNFLKDQDEFYWNITGNSWDFPIYHVTATITLPEEAQILQSRAYTGTIGAKGNDYTVATPSQNQIIFTSTKPLPPGQGLTVAISWPQGIVKKPSAMTKIKYQVQDNKSIVIALEVLIVLICYNLCIWCLYGRDPHRGTIIPLFEPPLNLSPAAVRYILKMGFDMKTLTAAIVNLATQGFINIASVKDKFTLTQITQDTGRLTSDEKIVAENLFAKKSTIDLNADNNTIISKTKSKLRSSLSNDYKNKFFLTNSFYSVPSILLSLLALIATINTAPDKGMAFGALFWLGFWTFGCYILFITLINDIRFAFNMRSFSSLSKLIFSSFFALPFFAGEVIGIFILSNAISPMIMAIFLMIILIDILFYYLLKTPTEQGRHVMDQIEGFKLFLSTTERYRLDKLNPPKMTPKLFEKYLPYAIALGVETQWGEQFNELLTLSGMDKTSYAPTWYSGTAWNSNNVPSFTNYLNSGLTSSLISSSISSSSSASGGGGSSGGGGGGGGGGGW